MKRPKKLFRTSALSDTATRRLRSTPSYFWLLWRWSMWLYALIIILFFHGGHFISANSPLAHNNLAALLLVITFIQTLVVTLYAPVIQVLLPRMLRQTTTLGNRRAQQQNLSATEDGEAQEIVPPLTRTHNQYWNIAIYSLDVIICGLVTYYSGPFSDPPFGVGSPFYRYGLSAVFSAALAYGYTGGFAAAIGYDLIVSLGMIIPAPGAPIHPSYPLNILDIVGSLLDAPVVAALTAYIAMLLASYAQSKKREQENVRRQKYLIRVGQTLLKGTNDRQELLQRSATQILQGGHFARLIIALIEHPGADAEQSAATPYISTRVEVTAPGEDFTRDQDDLAEEVLRTGENVITFQPLRDKAAGGYGLARCYLLFKKDGKAHMVIGAEGRRTTPFGERQKELLNIAGPQVLVALDNIRLTEQMVQMAATAERGRIAREIHDGIAQLIYMLSLNAETCEAQAYRIAEASDEDAALVTPLAERLGRLVTISKQALWETRNYMFSLKPLISGTTTVTQMLTNQLREFEAISDLTTHLTVEGTEVLPDGDQRRANRYAQAGTALFRIVQEALTNAYKHAEATQIDVTLRFNASEIAVEVCDNGKGLPVASYHGHAIDGEHRIYSGHGMSGMQERAAELGGSVEVIARTDGGVRVHACIPY